jgi:hypothetical protein
MNLNAAQSLKSQSSEVICRTFADLTSRLRHFPSEFTNYFLPRLRPFPVDQKVGVFFPVQELLSAATEFGL